MSVGWHGGRSDVDSTAIAVSAVFAAIVIRQAHTMGVAGAAWDDLSRGSFIVSLARVTYQIERMRSRRASRRGAWTRSKTTGPSSR